MTRSSLTTAGIVLATVLGVGNLPAPLASFNASRRRRGGIPPAAVQLPQGLLQGHGLRPRPARQRRLDPL